MTVISGQQAKQNKSGQWTSALNTLKVIRRPEVSKQSCSNYSRLSSA